MDCKLEAASHYAGCDCNEAHWQNEFARLTRERDEARERAAEVPGLRLRLAQAEGSASEAEAAWKTENGKLRAAESRAARLEEKVRRIQSACGLPNPAEACRVVLAIAAEEGK